VLEMTGMLPTSATRTWPISPPTSPARKAASAPPIPNWSSGRALFNGGDLEKGMPACTGCHSPNGAGIALAGFPHLGGQHSQYVTKQLTDFREGNRTNDGDAMTMRTIAGKLSNKDIEGQLHQGLLNFRLML
jgi:cytochrome c553